MFAGGRRRSSNIRAMQLFHELKQQFPTVPDHIVNACIASHAPKSTDDLADVNFIIREVLEAAASLSSSTSSSPDYPPMGRSLTKPVTPVDSLAELFTFPEAKNQNKPLSPTTGSELERNQNKMTEGDSDFNRNILTTGDSVCYSKETETVCVNPATTLLDENVIHVGNNLLFAKRPNHLNIYCETSSGLFNKIQPSERCFDIQKLLISENVNVKPPRSPVSAKRVLTKSSPIKCEQTKSPLVQSPELSTRPPECKQQPTKVEAPTQTTDTLLESVNLSLNVNCQMDVVQSPTGLKRNSVLHITPQVPWFYDPGSPVSLRSFTSVNLTLRPPSSVPQAPIDITSQNSSLTYSTTSFDSQKGLQSRLQITVGPGGAGNVSSIRTRPRSSYHPQESLEVGVPLRAAGSLPDLAAKEQGM